MPVRELPADPSLVHLRKESKRLQKSVRAGDASGVALVREWHPHHSDALEHFALADAQLVIARSYGFSSWPRIKDYVSGVETFSWNPPPPPTNTSSVEDTFVQHACLDYASWRPSNIGRAHRLLEGQPHVAQLTIYTAAAAGDVTVVREYLDRDPSLLDARGGLLHWEPLLYACYSRVEPTDTSHSTVEVVRLLLSRGANPDAGFLWDGRYLYTALTGAFGRGEDWNNQPPHPRSIDVATAVLDAGADPNDSQTLYNRHFQPDNEHLKLLFRYGLGRRAVGPWLKRLGERAESPARMLVQELCWAASHGFLERIVLLVHNGVDVNAPSPRTNRTAYEEAVRSGHSEIADWLAQHGATRVALDPLELFAQACIAGRRDEARTRLAGDPSLLDRMGHFGRIELVHRACESGNRDAVRVVVELGLDINGLVPESALDRAILHNAAGWGTQEMIRLILELGGNPHLRDATYHSTPIGWADHNHRDDAVAILMPFADIFDAVRCEGVERATALLDADAALARAIDERGVPLIFYVRLDGPRRDDMIRVLAARAIDLNAALPDGRTILDVALAQSMDDVASALRGHGCLTAAELA